MFSQKKLEEKVNDFDAKETHDDKHLILYFDINDTIITGDAVQNISSSDAILKLLAECYKAAWTKDTKEMTYREYVENHLCPGNGKDPIIKKQRMEYYKNFVEFLRENQHPLLDKIEKELHELQQALKEGDVFPSLIALIEHLNTTRQKYTLVLRTFGEDGPKVMEELERRTSVKFSRHGHFKKENLITDSGEVIVNPLKMLQYLEPHQHANVRDDHRYWHKAEGSYCCETYDRGKQMLLSFDDSTKLTLFFDDNAAKQILRVRSTSGVALAQEKIQLKLREIGRIVKVNTLDAIRNKKYFVEKIQAALKNSAIKLNEDDYLKSHLEKLTEASIADFSVFPKPCTSTSSPSDDSKNKMDVRQVF